MAHLDERLRGGSNKDRWFAAQDAARDLFGQLIGAAGTDIAVVKNVSEGISAVASALPWKPGESVALCSAFEHANNAVLGAPYSARSEGG